MITTVASRAKALTRVSGRESPPAPAASVRGAQQTALAEPRVARSPPAPRDPARHHARRDRLRGAGGARDYAEPRAAPGDSRRSQHASGRSILARARSAQDDRSACPAGRAPGIRRWWSVVGVERGRRSDGQPFAALRPTALQHLSSALRLHALAKPMRLGSAASIGLKRSLHRAGLPSGRRTDTV